MKYQIYLRKEVSEIIEGIAKATNQKCSTFIKDFIETSFLALINEQPEEVQKFKERIINGTRK